MIPLSLRHIQVWQGYIGTNILLEGIFLRKFYGFCSYPCDIALSFDNKLAEAYTVRGDYYTYKGVIR